MLKYALESIPDLLGPADLVLLYKALEFQAPYTDEGIALRSRLQNIIEQRKRNEEYTRNATFKVVAIPRHTFSSASIPSDLIFDHIFPNISGGKFRLFEMGDHALMPEFIEITNPEGQKVYRINRYDVRSSPAFYWRPVPSKTEKPTDA